MKVKITDLVPSQFSTGIYSPNPPEDLIESIRVNGVLAPIWINADNIIISGHRRVEACRQLGIVEIDAEVREYSDLLVIESNRYRQKTWTERLKEAEALEKILKPLAEEREKAGKADPLPNLAKGIDTREEMAKFIGISHGTTAFLEWK
jgi:ParB-like chromosome segregation protein Spo0J